MASYYEMRTRVPMPNRLAGVPQQSVGARPMPPPGMQTAPGYLNPVAGGNKPVPGAGMPSGGMAAVPGFGIEPNRPGVPSPSGRFSDPVVGPGGQRPTPLSNRPTDDKQRGFGMNYNLGTMELFKNIQGMGGMERNEYLQSMRNNLMQRLARYDEIRQRGFGGEMGEDAMRDYRAIQQSLNDINKMMTDPAFMAQLQAAMTAGDLDARSVTLSAPSGNVNLSDFRRGAY